MGLPWLSAAQNLQRRTMDRRLERIRAQEELPAWLTEALSGWADDVFATERLVLDAHSLLLRSGCELLSESEWAGLGSMVQRLRLDLRREQDRLHWTLAESVEGGPLPAWAESLSQELTQELTQELRQRLASACRHLSSDRPGWEAAVRIVEARFPIPAPNGVSATTRVEVQSRLVTGRALGSCFVNGYPADGLGNPLRAARYMHVTGLAQTVLKNTNEQTLFSGLRHGIVDAEELDGPLLSTLPNEELRTLVGEFVLGEGAPKSCGRTRAQEIGDRCDEIRARTVWAANDAIVIRSKACKRLARESAVAALVADQGKLRRALDGNTVHLRLFAISLLTPDDCGNWRTQHRVFEELQQESPVELQVCDLNADGVARTVRADIQVRQFVLAAGEAALSPWAHQVGDGEIERLLGPRHVSDLGGDIEASLRDGNRRQARLADRFVELDQRRSRLVGERGANHPQARKLHFSILESRERGALAEKRTRTLIDIGKQLKAMWIEAGELPRGVEAHRRAAARLALAGCLMRETPVLICMSGRDFTRQLDPEIKFLATVADNLHGHLPFVEQRMEAWEEARSAFSPH